MGRAMSIGAAFALVIFPPDCGMTLLVSELAFATRTMREAVEQGGSLPVCLSICVQRAALKTPDSCHFRPPSNQRIRGDDR